MAVVSFTAVVNVPESPQAQLRRCPTIYYSRRRRISMASTSQELLSSPIIPKVFRLFPAVTSSVLTDKSSVQECCCFPVF